MWVPLGAGCLRREHPSIARDSLTQQTALSTVSRSGGPHVSDTNRTPPPGADSSAGGVAGYDADSKENKEELAC